MNSYPFGVSELLLAPPPPPPPPDSTVIDASKALNSEGASTVVTNNQIPSYPNHYHQDGGYPGLPQTMMPPVNVPHHVALPPRSNPGGMMILPHSHLSLPPPPPPPPPIATAPNEVPHASNHYGTPYHNNGFGPPPRLMRHNHHKFQPHGKHHPYRGGPSPWAQIKQGPAGLQGPWQAPKVERPSGAFEQLHPPGVSCDQNAGMGPIGEPSQIPFSDTSSCTGTGSESNNFMGLKFTAAATTYKDHNVDPKDPKLPRELTDMFEALNCKLCEVLSSSTVQAKHHYSGKPHEKKVRQWLQKWSEETGQPMPKRQKLETTLSDVNPEDLYCKLCDVTFTSVKHGEQHKMGKPHQKALRLGYSTAKPKSKKVDTSCDPAGRFGIGEAFQNPTSNKDPENIKSEAIQDSELVTPSPILKVAPLPSKFFCELCQISTTSQEHLDSHFVGAKHRKALVNAARSGIKPEISLVPPPVEPAESILASVISDSNLSKTKTISADLSIYRTPSGQFYCSPCNTTVNSEKSFKEHTESKRHKYKVASSKRP